MKFTVDVECTPQEARAFLGLPDLTRVHEAYVATLTDGLKNGITPDMVEGLIRNWAPMGEAGMKLWSGLFEGATRGSKG